MNKTLKVKRRKIVVLFLIISLLSTPLNVFAFSKPITTKNEPNTTQSEPITMQDVIITFKSNVDVNVLNYIKNKNGIVEWKPEELKSISAVVPSNEIENIKKYTTVKGVEIDSVMRIKAQMKDWGIDKTNTPTSWNLNYTGKGVKISVLDTGISQHEDLFISGGASFVSYTTSYQDDQGHGTHVAGIIGAKNNSIGTVGVAPDSQIYAVKVLGSNGSGMMSSIISGIDWSIANDMDIINMSLGSQSDSIALRDAVTRATNAGIMVIVAAGNDGNTNGTGDTVDYPGKFPNAITVAATDLNNNKASFSSAGPSVDIAAPGVNIHSTLRNGSYGLMSGTSMATPYVSGVAALYKEAYPNYSDSQIETLLKNNAVDLGKVGLDNLFGVGLVQSPKTQGTAEVPSAPTTPLNFKADEILSDSIALSWNTVNNATLYELKRNGVVIYTGSDTSFIDKKLTKGTSYNYTLVAKNIGGVSSPATLKVATKSPTLASPRVSKVVTTDSVKLSWKKINYATSYQIKRDGVIVYEGSQLTFMDTGLDSSTLYSYEIMATNDGGGISKPTLLKVTTLPDAPTNLVEIHTSETAELAWSEVQGATYYLVKDNKTKKTVYKGSATTVTLTKLKAGVEYSYTVYAGNAGGLSVPISITLITTPKAPDTPVLTKISATQNKMALTWKSIYNAKIYEVKRNGTVVYSGPLLKFTDSGLNSGVEYTYTITAKNETGTSSSLIVKKATIPSTPTNIKATPSTNQVLLQWDAVPGATYYVVKQDGKQIYRGPLTSYTKTGLQSGKTSKYTVFAGNVSGISPSSVVANITTDQTAPAAPIITKIIAKQNNMALNWKSIYNAKIYEVKRNGTVVYSGPLLKFTDSGLTPGVEYTYIVTAKNDVGSSSSLGVKKATTPSTPTNIKATPSTNHVLLQWDAVPGATYYIVKKDGRQIYKGPWTSYTNTGLLSGKTSKYTVLAGNVSGVSTSSVVANITTIQTAPATPVLTRASVTNNKVTLTWSSVYNARVYEVQRNGEVVYSGPLKKYYDSGLTPGVVYNYTITAKNDAGSSSDLEIKTYTTY